MNESGWQSLRRPNQVRRAVGAEGFIITPFMRLARVHAAAAASDAAIAVALAGSIFFSISPQESRWRVALYLLVTMAPFAVVTPLIGPAIDRLRGGRRVMIVVTVIGRVALAFMISRHFDSLLLFPEAFGLLVMQKGYAVAKSALVPQLSTNGEDLVTLNSRLSLISATAGIFGATISGIASLIAGPAGAASVATFGFLVATVLASKLPRIVVAAGPPADLERAELRDRAVILAASATAILRGIVGFVTFLLAFEFRGGSDGLDVGAQGAALGGAAATVRGIDITGDPSAPAWHFGVVLAGAGAGAVLAARFAPRLRSRFNEERMLQGVLLATVVSGIFAAFAGGLSGATLLSFTVAISATTGKLAFDSLVQRDAPDANYGRTFSKFEARFQIAWVVGAFFPAVIPLNTPVGAAAVAIAAGLALVSYMVGRPVGAIVKSGVQTGVRNGYLKKPHFRWPHGGGTTQDAPIDETGVDPTTELENPVGDELTDEDLRPSQPSPPSSAGEWHASASWSSTPSPYISSVEGVVVDPEPGSDSEIDSGQP